MRREGAQGGNLTVSVKKQKSRPARWEPAGKGQLCLGGAPQAGSLWRPSEAYIISNPRAEQYCKTIRCRGLGYNRVTEWRCRSGAAEESTSRDVYEAVANCVNHEFGGFVDAERLHDIRAMNGDGVCT